MYHPKGFTAWMADVAQDPLMYVLATLITAAVLLLIVIAKSAWRSSNPARQNLIPVIDAGDGLDVRLSR